MPETADDLYGLDPGSFIAGRDALAKALRAGGDRAGAATVKKLRRPSPTAWALNQVARRDPGLVQDVLDAGTALRTATDQAVGGDPSAMRAAKAVERKAVDAAVGVAGRYLEEAGHAAGAARQRLAATLHAAMVDDAVAARLVHGTLDQDQDASGFGLDLAGWPDTAVEPEPGPGSHPPEESGATPEVLHPEEAGSRIRDRVEEAAPRVGAEPDTRDEPSGERLDLEAEADRLTGRAGRLRTAAEDADRRAAAARTQAEDADRRAAAARTQAEDADRRAAAARTQAEDADRRAAAARTEAEDAGRRAAAARTEAEDAGRRAAAARTEAEDAGRRAAAARTEAEDAGRRAAAAEEALRQTRAGEGNGAGSGTGTGTGTGTG